MQGVSKASPMERIEVAIFYFVLYCGTTLIVWESRHYFLPGMIHGFVLERIELALEDWWRYTLTAHVTGGLLCLLASLLQYSELLLKRATWLHRNLGRIYALSIIMVVFPTGVALAFVAKGGLSGTIGFLALSFATLFSLLLGMVAIYKKNLRSHQAWMSRSFALITSAITFRALQFFLMYSGLSAEKIYQLSLWLSIIINLALCEYYLLKTNKLKK